ncbi:hypothetical protein T190_00720 [Sinorhizobium meliloti CCBAU 01290]|nr:hypothetical protein T190_00720 [Sinorhizobium meliloti CCBAU 01290]
MNVQIGRYARIDLLEEIQEFGGTVPLVAFADDKAGGDIQSGKQRGCAVSDIGMRAPFRHARHHRQHWLLAVESLDLALLVHAENQRPIGR